ncbi:MAG: ferrous iron transporter B [Phycisphaerales bacterium]|nr:ferrous iron transporter B [Phycisphaerales bacterium]
MSGPDSGVKDVGLEASGVPRRIALLGNPNTGKTTLFNRMSGLRHKTSNFPGTTLEARVAFVRAGVEGGRDADLIDLPGIYALELDQIEARVCREVLAGTAAPRGEPLGAPDCAVVVVDAANLARNMMLVGEVVRRRLPTVIAVNMIDLAEGKGIKLDPARLSEALGCEVVPTNARAGDGVDELRLAIRRARIPAPVEAVPAEVQGLRHWAQEMADRALHPEHVGEVPDILEETKSDRADKLIMHPLLGPVIFAGVMTGLFYVLFILAKYPMDWIGAIFSGNGDWVAGWQPQWLQHVIGSGAVGVVKDVMPDGILRDLLTDGVIAGVGSTVVFLPQICLLFFLIALLEDTGYLARGAFVMDRLLRPFGLPGHAFVPLLSSHACALPGIMATRAIPDPKERLATILVAPFMTCSARLPVYILLTTLLFKDRPMMAALAFVGCYALGILAGVFSALIARRTILRGKSRAMVMELPSYKWPSVRSAVLGTIDRGWVFLKNAGTVILMICIVLWWMGAYPHVQPPAEASAMREQATVLREPYKQDAVPEAVAAEAEELDSAAARIEARHAAANSFLGRIGQTVQPVFQPLGFDWQLTIGVMASFAAREVFVSTMNVVIAGQEEGGDEQGEQRLMQQIQDAKRSDGATPVFTPAVSWALLVFFVLAMQCLPTLAVTAKEAGGVKWALLQLAWMSGMAYIAALIVYQVMR